MERAAVLEASEVRRDVEVNGLLLPVWCDNGHDVINMASVVA